MTPIVWQYDTLLRNPAVAERARIAEINPVLHYVEILRQPLLGQPILGRHWVVVGVITVLGCARRAGLPAQLPLARRVLGVRRA